MRKREIKNACNSGAMYLRGFFAWSHINHHDKTEVIERIVCICTILFYFTTNKLFSL